MAVDESKLSPQYADSWYNDPPTDELRREVQHIYELLKELNAEIVANAEAIAP